jgi:hypothetical protein
MICVKCFADLSPDQFYENRRGCKECTKRSNAAYRKANAAATKVTKKRYYEINRRTMIDYALGRYHANKALILSQLRERERKNRRENPGLIITRRIGKRLAKVLDRRPKGWREQLGYDPSLLIPHLEAQFEPWMTWDNYGTAWHLEHIRPVSSFDLPAQIAECWALSNLRPMEAIGNLRKGAQWQPTA